MLDNLVFYRSPPLPVSLSPDCASLALSMSFLKIRQDFYCLLIDIATELPHSYVPMPARVGHNAQVNAISETRFKCADISLQLVHLHKSSSQIACYILLLDVIAK